MQLTFIGTGDCAGVPVYNCTCPICAESRTNPQKRRSSCCAYLTTETTRLLIDAGAPDLGDRFSRNAIDLILLSHYHIDHVYGLFPMRWGSSCKPIPVYGPDYPKGCADLLQHPGIFDFSHTLQPFISQQLADIEITPLPLNPSKPSLGYALKYGNSRLAWLSDTSGLPGDTINFLKKWIPSTMVLDCTFPPLEHPHPNHNDIDSAIALHHAIGPESTYLTHISHDLDFWFSTSGFLLPQGLHLAKDGLHISV